jgi:hypothetical protein
LTYKHPEIAIAVVVVLVIGMAIVLPLIWRVLRFGFHGVAGRIRALFPGAGPKPLPEWVGASAEAVPCFARTVAKVPKMRRGYLIFEKDGGHFACHGWLGKKVTPVDTAGLTLTPGLLFDVLATDRWTVYVTKDCSRDLGRRRSLKVASRLQSA